ncbi:MAG TPA: universal stress protein [Candidatus Acidoferrales bacterium]|nr:universal stress protein [Candidatus Acidoferrales bacterium]
MITIKRILVPTDFSAESVPALGYAISLARDLGAEVLIVHTLSPKAMKEHLSERYIPGGVVSPAEAPVPLAPEPNLEGLFESKRQLLRNFLEQKIAHELSAAVKIVPVVRMGKVVDEIVAAAKEEQCDVIVMTSAASRLRRLFRGSITERVIRKAPCPVLTILPSAEIRTEKNERVPVMMVEKWAA